MDKNKYPLIEIRNFQANDEELIIDKGNYPFCNLVYFDEKLFEKI